MARPGESGAEASLDALDEQRIRGLIASPLSGLLNGLSVLAETDSTNSALRSLPLEQQHGRAILAETQTRGRGRRERRWHSPPGRNVYLSLGWHFANTSVPLSTLPLAVAVCTCRALSKCGLVGHGIKWPNDILAGGAKLAGILVEMSTAAGGPATAVIGVGVNVNMTHGETVRSDANAVIEKSWTDMASQIPSASAVLSRTVVAAKLLEELLAGASDFESTGFATFHEDWSELDLLSGLEVQILEQGKSTTGIARGISPDGGLLLAVRGPDKVARTRVFRAGEVSVARD